MHGRNQTKHMYSIKKFFVVKIVCFQKDSRIPLRLIKSLWIYSVAFVESFGHLANIQPLFEQ